VIWGCHGHRKCQCLIEYIRFLRRFRKMRRSCTVCEQFVESHKVLLLHVFGDMHVFDTYLICICVELLYLNEFEFGLTSMRHRVVSVPNYHILYPKTRHATFGHNFSSKHTPISEILTVKSPPQKKNCLHVSGRDFRLTRTALLHCLVCDPKHTPILGNLSSIA